MEKTCRGRSSPYRQTFNVGCKGKEILTATDQMENVMLWTICVILIVLWLLGIVTSYTMGGLIHVLLVSAVVMVLVRIIQGRKIL